MAALTPFDGLAEVAEAGFAETVSLDEADGFATFPLAASV